VVFSPLSNHWINEYLTGVTDQDCIENSMLLRMFNIDSIRCNVGRIPSDVIVHLYSIPVLKVLIIGSDSNTKEGMSRDDDNFCMQSNMFYCRCQQNCQFNTHTTLLLQHLCRQLDILGGDITIAGSPIWYTFLDIMDAIINSNSVINGIHLINYLPATCLGVPNHCRRGRWWLH